MSEGHGSRFVVPAAVVIVALCLLGALDNEFVNWDDGIYIANNPLVTAPGEQPWRERLLTPALGYPLPIPVLVYGWLWRIAEAAWPFHAFTVGVHLLNAGLLAHLLRRADVDPMVTATAVLAFGVHPVVVEPAVWATGLKDLLTATGALLALLGIRRGLAAVPGALLAFGSKPTSILLAMPLFAAHRVAGPTDARRARAARVAIGLVAMLGVALAWSTIIQESPGLRTSSREAFSIGRVLGALGLQVEHIVAPATLAPRYAPTGVGPLEIVIGGVAVVVVTIAAMRWTSRRDPRLVWLALGVATYLPVSNLRPLERFTADSYVYIPWMAAVACLALTWPDLRQRLAARGDRVMLGVRAFIGVVLLSWMGLTVMQVEVWSDSRSLWRDCYLEQPSDPETIYRYGDALGRAGQLREELAVYLEHEDDLADAERIPVVLPVYYERSGDLGRAMVWFERAFASPVEQDEGMYWHYVEFVGRSPGRHPPALDDALAYGLDSYLRQRGTKRLDPDQRVALAGHATRLSMPAAASVLSR